jgi:hypothetical protein
MLPRLALAALLCAAATLGPGLQGLLRLRKGFRKAKAFLSGQDEKV